MCPLESELQVGLGVFNNKYGDTFQEIFLRSGIRIGVYRGWNSMPLDVAFVALSERGEAACFSLLSQLASSEIQSRIWWS